MEKLRGKIEEGCEQIQINLKDNIINDKENSVMKSWKVLYGNGATEMEHEYDEAWDKAMEGCNKWTEEWNNGEGLRNSGIEAWDKAMEGCSKWTEEWNNGEGLWDNGFEGWGEYVERKEGGMENWATF